MIYISHPYGGKEENMKEVEGIIHSLVSAYPGITFVSPIHAFSFLYHNTEYFQGLKFCLDLLAKCECMWVFGDWQNSVGCTEEIKFCKLHDIPYLIMNIDEVDFIARQKND